MQFPGLLAVLAATAGDPTAVTSVRELEQEVERRAAIGVEAQVHFDDNILKLDDGEARPGLVREDARLTTSAVVDLATRLSLQRVYVRGRAGYDFYRNNSFLDRERIALEGGVDWRIGTRCDGNVSAVYSRQQSNFEDLELVIRNTQETQIYQVEGGCDVGLAFRPEFQVRQRISDNSAPILKRRDLRVTNYAVGLQYSRNEFGSLGLQLYKDAFGLPNRLVPGSDGSQETSVQGVRASLSRRFKDFRTVGRLGYANVDARDPTAAEYDGVTWLGSLVWGPTPRFRLAATGRREIDASAQVAAGYFIRDAADLASRLRVGRAVAFELGASVERRRFRDLDPLAVQRREDRTILFRAGVEYRPVPAIQTELAVERQERDADVPLGDYESNRLIASISAGF